MGAPYTSVSVSNYNANPPADDGSQTEANRVKWATIKTKLTDPPKTAIESINTNVAAAFGKVVGGAGVTSTAISYQVLSTDQSKLVRASAAGITITTPDATGVTSPFAFGVVNDSTGDITLDGSGSQTIDGETALTLGPGDGVLLFTDGSNWFAIGQKRVLTVRETGFAVINGSLTVSVAASALTVAVKGQNGSDPSTTNPVYVLFRNVTAATGDFTLMKLTAATSLVVSGGSTLGTTSSVAFRVWIVGFNDGGTFRLGVINCRSGVNIFPLSAWGIASSTAEGGAGGADSAHTFYTGTAVSSKPYAVLGYMTWESGLGTAGTWSAGPTRAQLFGHGVPLPGQRVQQQISASGAVATGTTQIPSDNSIPQNTEGDEYLAQAVTPSSAANVLNIEHRGVYTNSNASAVPITTALFQDSTADALASMTGYTVGQALVAIISLAYAMVAGTSSATTLKIRTGAGSAGTTTFNGSGGARLQGGVMASFLRVEEVMA